MVTNRLVVVIVLSPDESTINIGGDFTYVEPNTGSVDTINESGNFTTDISKVNSKICSVFTDGSGG